ncbi:MAG TPA: DedA family protein [Actinomycetota bacterium]|nr:DedA family protein [Actinomycetota bacterium]
MPVAVLPENAELPSPIPTSARCYPRWTLEAPGSPTLLALFSSFVTDEVARYGELAIFLLMVLESACVPIPSEVTMLFGGALVSAPILAPDLRLSLWAVIAAGVAGNLVGSWLAYGVGYLGGRPLVDRFGRYLLLRPSELDRAHGWFERHGPKAVLLGRLLPVVRTFISLPAGVARMRFARFTAYTMLGCLPWCAALALLGYALGGRWDEVEGVIRPFAWAIAIVLIAGIGWWFWRRIRAVRARSRAGTTADRVSPSGTPDA